MLLTAIIVRNLLACAALLAACVLPIRRPSALMGLGLSGLLLFAGLLLSGPWLYPPTWFAWIYLGAFVSIIALRWRYETPNGTSKLATSWIASAIFGVLGLLLVWQGLQGRTEPEGKALDLASPMPEGSGYCAISGGNSLLLNAHFLLDTSPAARVEIHAVDFIRMNSVGFRTRSDEAWKPKPSNPKLYAVYDAVVYAPCSGRILSAVDGKPDNLAGHRYRSPNGANAVTLACNGAFVSLVHLRSGTLTVRPGDSIDAGDVIGRVGNSGNTEEPHLHVHAHTVPTSESPFGDPLPLTFNGRSLSAGSCL